METEVMAAGQGKKAPGEPAAWAGRGL